MGTSVVYSPIHRAAVSIWRSAREQLTIVSPWMKMEAVLDVERCTQLPMSRWRVVTVGHIRDFVEGASDLEALRILVERGADVRIVSGLHAKVFIADRTLALLGSANLTVSGMHHNVEAASLTDDAALVDTLANEAEAWQARGRRIELGWIEEVLKRLANIPAAATPPIEAPDLEGPDISLPEAPSEHSRPEAAPEAREGAYTQLPLPTEWKAVLESLCLMPVPPPLLQPHADLAPAVDRVLSHLAPRERSILRSRLGLERTLQDIGDSEGRTRERIRQIERAALRKIDAGDADSRADFVDLLGRWLRLSDRPVIRTLSALIGPSEAAELRLAMGLLFEITGRELSLREGPDRWVILDAASECGLWQLLESHFQEPRFISRDGLADAVDIPEESLDAFAALPDSRLRPLNGYYGWQWSKQDCMVAVARHLAAAGHSEWHISEMARALEFIDPVGFVGFGPHDIGGIVARPGIRDLFESIGRAGSWRLREHGDGFRNTFDAVQSLLRSAPSPLHISDILANLRRPVSRNALGALLRGNPSAREFRSFGDAIFGLPDLSYGRTDGFRHVEAWLLARVANGQEVAVSLLKALARADGVRFDCLIGVAKVSDRLAYRPGSRGFSAIRRA